MNKNSVNNKTNKEEVEIARLRFAVIAPVIMNTYTELTKTAYYKKVADKPLKLPDGKEVMYKYNTFEKWEGLYKKYGLDGLLPKTRNDSGTTRVLSEKAIAEIYRLKDKFPRINSTLIYTKLVEDGVINQSEVSLCTVQRFVKKNDLKSARNINVKDRKAFEEEYPCNMYQADTCHTIYITENGVKRKVYLISIVDDHTRAIVGA